MNVSAPGKDYGYYFISHHKATRPPEATNKKRW